MSDALDDGEFWLPPKFLIDEDNDNDNGVNLQKHAASLDVGRLYSDPTSPVNSMFGSTGSEDEEELFNILNRGLAQSSLYDEVQSARFKDPQVAAVSPQSTLYAAESLRRGGSGVGPGGGGACSSWDLLYAAAAAEEEMMARTRTRTCFYDSQQQHLSSLSTNGLFLPGPIPESGFHYQQRRVDAHRQLQFIQLQRMKLMQQEAQQILTMRKRRLAILEDQMRLSSKQQQVAGNRMNNWQTGVSPSDWPLKTNVNHSGGDMRALFIGEPHKARSGTGVFLPRLPGQPPSEPLRKRPGCPTVLIPERVVQALKLDLDETRSSVSGPAMLAAPGCSHNHGNKFNYTATNRSTMQNRSGDVRQSSPNFSTWGNLLPGDDDDLHLHRHLSS